MLNFRPNLGKAPPVSNLERQRAFRKRNPGYYQRLHAKRSAGHKASAQAALADFKALPSLAQEQAKANAAPLMLPAPPESLPCIDFNTLAAPGIPGTPGTPAAAQRELLLVRVDCPAA